MRSRFLLVWVVAAFAVAALVVAPMAHLAHASASGIVISAVYPGGGDATGPGSTIISPYSKDYIEIFNAGTTAVNITGWSVQYRHADGTSWQKTQITLPTTLQPGQYYLIEAGGGTDGGDPLPTPDNTNAANMRRAGHVIVALMSTLDTIQTLNPVDDPNSVDDIEDIFGAGDATTALPSVFETAPRTGILDNTQAWFRNNNGCQDTENNLNDFAAGPVAGKARNTATIVPCTATADLVVAVTDSADPVLTGAPITYTVDVDNIGAAAANSGVVTVGLTGTAYPGSISNLSNTTDCSFTNPTITCNVASIAASGSFTFTFQVTPTVTGTVTANATVSSAAPEIGGNNTDSESTTVNAPVVPADVNVSITDTPDPVTAGNPVAYTVTVNNIGGGAASNTVLTVTLGGASFPGTVANLTGTNCTFTNPTITCNIGALAATTGTTNVTFNVTPTTAGTITAAATVSATAPETAGNNTDNETTTVNPVPTFADVGVTISDSPDPVTAPNPVAYTITVNNTGTGAAANTVLTATLGGTSFPNAITGLTGTGCSFSTPTITCNIGALAATNGTTNVTFNVTPTAEGTITVNATVSATEPENNDANNTDAETTVVNAPIPTGATGTIESTATITTGGSVVVTVTDEDLSGTGTVTVSAVGTSGDSETLTLTETGTAGTFSGTFPVADAAAVVGNGALEEADGSITFTYVDELDEEGDVDTSLSDVTEVNPVIPPLGAFNLVSPAEGEILRTADTTFTWTESANATSYEIFVSHLSSNTRIGETYTDTVPSASCAAGICSWASSELVADLGHGTYSWTVIATDGTTEAEAADGPNLFTVVVDTGVELVINGGFEDGNTGWTFTNGGKRRCAAFGNSSDCALNLKPAATAVQNGQMTGILANVESTAGDVLQVSAAVRSPRADRQRPVLVTIVYANSTAGAAGNGKDKIKLFVEEVTTGYETFSVNFVLDDAIVGGKVVVRNTLAAGKIRVDDVSVMLAPIGTIPRADAPVSTDGVLPVPAAPDNFRGNN